MGKHAVWAVALALTLLTLVFSIFLQLVSLSTSAVFSTGAVGGAWMVQKTYGNGGNPKALRSRPPLAVGHGHAIGPLPDIPKLVMGLLEKLVGLMRTKIGI
jgi:hypothetical protein